MKTLIESLERLSEAAYEALPLLEKYDYRKEADNYDDNKLELRVIPRLLQDILNNMLKYCAPIEHNGERIPDAALLNADNMRRFTENLNISGDWASLRQLNHIDLEPIKDIKDLLEEIGLSHQARLLENVCSFAANLRSPTQNSSNHRSTRNSAQSSAPVYSTLRRDKLSTRRSATTSRTTQKANHTSQSPQPSFF